MSKKVNIINNIIMLGITMALLFMCPTINDNAFNGDMALLILLYVVGAIVAGFVNTVIHELGHLIAGKIQGFVFVSMTVWFFKWTKENGKTSFSFCRLGDEAGYTEMVPKNAENLRKRYKKVTEGGIIASFFLMLLSVLPVALLDFMPVGLYAVLSMFLPLSTYFYLGSTLPMSSEGFKNDGAVARMLKKDTDECKVAVNILAIHSELYNGKRPSEIDERLYFDVPQLPEDNVYFFYLLDARYAYYVDKGEIENALKVNERLQSVLDYMPKIFRMTVMADALYNACVLKPDFDEADEIMYELEKYLNNVNTAQNIRIKLSYLICVLEEKEELKMFFDKAKREQDKMALKGLALYEGKLVESLKEKLS